MRQWVRRRRFLLAAALLPLVAVVAVGAVAGWVVHRGVAGSAVARPVAEPAVEPGVNTSAVAPDTDVPSAPQPSAPAQGTGPVTVRYAFDGGLGAAVVDEGGRLPLKVRKAAGGELAPLAHEGGLAVRFPPPCEHYGAESCARVILQSGPADFLNPGRREFGYGASVLVQSGETSKGANVIQKGFSVGDSQFKLQVDGEAGQPSCVIVGTHGSAIYVALASQSVADGRWHRIACARSNALLTVAVDGSVRGRATIPSSLSIANDDPLCIGGKGTSANNDQFVGAIDDVFVTRAA